MVVFFQMSITNIKAFQKHVEINNIEVQRIQAIMPDNA